MSTNDIDPNINQDMNIYSGNTGGEYFMYQDENWDNNIVDVNDFKITVDQGSISNTDFMFLYKGEWVTIISVVQRLEKTEKFIEAFIETFDKGITLDKISKMRDIWFDDHDNTEDEWDTETAGAPMPIKNQMPLRDPGWEIDNKEKTDKNKFMLVDEDLNIII